ncbi:type III-A CRISPR-associated protein Cas10/Csm1 [Membranicola marinus]|uniref:CRISPR system single-strand-specific deoxyribonuclease Cas10/Csm1 (subtype III-A) n=1 Tax=Membranihabitans marinus TaxID=1227546 RepID=A0A953LBH6_9BACT|nr:type III-A CRISPR-associated protein Cas10/Csm1 [Membranihabitans marinus]MBY5959773.1 type III-A CRISPR-associated protein Cas10/Csm1 [Membranihabitans marinus]
MIERITIAALLHDIGKFYQRGQENIATDSDLYRRYKKLMTLICPENRYGGLGYKHAFWTYKFFEDFGTKFRELMQNLNEEFGTDATETNEDNLINLSIYHHNPHSEVQALIQMADWWSSGLDRRNDSFAMEEKYDEAIDFGKYAFRRRPLESIFQNISLDKNTGSPEKEQPNESSYRYGYLLRALDLKKDSIFPYRLTQDGIKDLTPEYNILYNQFKEDFLKIPVKNYRVFIDTLDHILKKFTWCIPSSTIGMANVSLYNHLKTTAGIAACLYKYQKSTEEDVGIDPYEYNSTEQRIRIKDNHYPVLLTCIDISGIQSFIYNIASRKAAMSLKGRSYYLHLLMQSVIKEICNHKAIQLSTIQTIYNSGGKAYLFLPNTKAVKKALEEVKKEMERRLWNTHKLTLYLCIGYVPFRYRFDKQQDGSFKTGLVTTEEKVIQMEDLWKMVSEEAAKSKSRKYESIIAPNSNSGDSIFHLLFGNGEEGIELDFTDKYDICTGEPLYGMDFKTLDTHDASEKKVYVSKETYVQTELGRVLKDADFNFSFSKHHSFEDKNYKTNKRLSIRPLNGNTGFHLFDDLNLIDGEDADFRKIVSSSDVHCDMLNRTDFMKFYLKGYNASYGFSFYGGNKQPQSEYGRLKTFNELVIAENGKSAKLGVLRMDVDNLGSIFIRGLSKELKTFSAYATLSSQLDIFFSGFLNTIRNADKYKDFVSILYSGGDDIFAVGRWDRILDFGLEVRESFKEFTCHNPNIDISGGLILTGAKFPISKSAQMAGEAETSAKNFERNINSKKTNRAAISLFGIQVGWEEWNDVEKYKEILEKILDTHGSGVSLLHKIQIARTIKKDQESDSKTVVDYSYIWRLLYFLKRYSSKDNEEHIDKLYKKIMCSNQSRNIDLLAVAARWVELLNQLK